MFVDHAQLTSVLRFQSFKLFVQVLMFPTQLNLQTYDAKNFARRNIKLLQKHISPKQIDDLHNKAIFGEPKCA
jgi:hypothetical protein